MTQITPQTLQKLATLSRLSFPADQLAAFTQDFTNIMQFVESIQQVDTTGIPPLTTTVTTAQATLRPDVVTSPTSTQARDAALVGAPRADQGFFVVPKIVE